MRKRIYIYIFLLIISVAGAAVSLVYKEYLIFASTIVLVSLFTVYLVLEYKTNTRKMTYMLNALENDDSSFRFYDKDGDYYNQLFSNTLNRINEIFSSEKLNAREQEKYFELLLDNVITGIITVNKKMDVIHCNNKALQLLGLQVLTHLSQLKKIDESVYDAFVEQDLSEGKTLSFYTESGEEHYSLKCSSITLRNEKLIIYAINDIGEELEEKELEAWTRLIRVLTHEIMNTVTPISSLSDTLSMMIKGSDKLDIEHEKVFKEEIKQGLEVISLTSKGLISFVESYRNLTRIPTPNRKPIFVKDLLHRVITLEKDEFDKVGVQPTLDMQNDSILIYADENLISQVLVNLIKNATAALKESQLGDKALLLLKVFIDSSEDIHIEVTNNAEPISKEDIEHIFIPFFTTKSSGTGIGLSISRQIMRKHDGSLKLKCSNEKETTFALIFR